MTRNEDINVDNKDCEGQQRIKSPSDPGNLTVARLVARYQEISTVASSSALTPTAQCLEAWNSNISSG